MNQTQKAMLIITMSLLMIGVIAFAIVYLTQPASETDRDPGVALTTASTLWDQTTITTQPSYRLTEQSLAQSTDTSALEQRDFEDTIDSIKERYAAFMSIQSQCEQKIYTTHAKSYFYNDRLCALIEYPAVYPSDEFSEDEFKNIEYHWYVDEEEQEIYFMLLINRQNNNEYRLYFDHGTLIRFVDEHGVIHDSDGYRFEEMQAVYEPAWEACTAEIERHASGN